MSDYPKITWDKYITEQSNLVLKDKRYDKD